MIISISNHLTWFWFSSPITPVRLATKKYLFKWSVKIKYFSLNRDLRHSSNYERFWCSNTLRGLKVGNLNGMYKSDTKFCRSNASKSIENNVSRWWSFHLLRFPQHLIFGIFFCWLHNYMHISSWTPKRT